MVITCSKRNGGVFANRKMRFFLTLFTSQAKHLHFNCQVWQRLVISKLKTVADYDRQNKQFAAKQLDSVFRII